MSLRSLSSCFGSNFRASSRNCTIWSRSRKVSGHHLSDIVLGSVETLDGVEHFLGDDVLIVRLLAFLAPEVELTLEDVAQNVGVLGLPPLEALLLAVALAVDLDEGQQLLKEAVTGKLEGGDGTLEALEEIGPNETDHLPLAVLLERVDVLVRTPVPMEGVVHREREERAFLREGFLEQVEHPPVGLPDRVRRHLRVLPLGEGGCVAILPNLAFASVRAAALDDEPAEDLVGEEDILGFGHMLRGIRAGLPHAAAKRPLHPVEMRPQVVHADRAREVGLVATGEELGHVAEVAQAVVDGRGRQHEHGLGAFRVVEQVEQAVVARRFDAPVGVGPAARIAEVVRLVDDDDVGELRNALETLREVPLASEVGMAEDGQIAEVRTAADAADVRKPPTQVGLPYPLLRGLGCEQHDSPAFVKDEPLDQHQTDEGLAKTYAVTEERAAVLPGDLHERPVRLFLIAIEVREHARPCLVPLGRGQLVSPEELLQGLRVDVEWRISVRMARDGLGDGLGDLFRFVPVRLEPFLELRDLARALNLDVQLDVLRETRPREVAGAHKRLSAHDLDLRVGDVSLCVELVLVVDPAFDLSGAERVEDRGDPPQEGVLRLVRLDTLVEPVECLRPDRCENGPTSPMGGLRPHQDPDLVEFLPLAVESEQGTDLEVSRRDVERPRDTGPLLQVPEPGPAGDTVVDDEEFAAPGVGGHDVPARTSSPTAEAHLPWDNEKRFKAPPLPAPRDSPAYGAARPRTLVRGAAARIRCRSCTRQDRRGGTAYR